MLNEEKSAPTNKEAYQRELDHNKEPLNRTPLGPGRANRRARVRASRPDGTVYTKPSIAARKAARRRGR